MNNENKQPNGLPLPLALWLLFNADQVMIEQVLGRKPNARERQPANMTEDDVKQLKAWGIKA